MECTVCHKKGQTVYGLYNANGTVIKRYCPECAVAAIAEKKSK